MSLDDRDERPEKRVPVRAEQVHVERYSGPEPGFFEVFFAGRSPKPKRELAVHVPTPAERRELARIEFRENPEMRVPCLLLLDRSGSTSGEPNDELNAGQEVYCRTLAENPLAAKRVETAVVSFGGGVHITGFATLDRLRMPRLQAHGDTPMAAAIIQGLKLLDERNRLYHDNRIATNTPLVFLVSDGAPTDPELWESAVRAVHRGEEDEQFLFFAIGVGDKADMGKLAELSRSRPPQRLRGFDFSGLLRWVARSASQISCSSPGDTVRFEPPGWMEHKVK